MKHFELKHIIWFLSIALLSGCDFMDCNESDYYTKEQLQGSYNRTKQLVTNIYGYLPHDFGNTAGAMHDAATDDAVHVYESSAIQRFVNGTWSPNYTVDNVFEKYYQAIHDANFYLETTKGLTFDEWKYADQYEGWMQDFENYQYEVRFLRAFFYFELVKRYQNIPLVTKVLTQKEANEVMPATADQIMDFIVSECIIIIDLLPVDYSGFVDKETGRITKGMALALKSRVTLYQASPLYSVHSKEKWITAARAAYELIGQSTELGYKLDKYANLFGADNNINPEVIMARPTGASNSFEAANFPMGVEGGKTSTCPTENLVSAYEMSNGAKFDWNNPVMKANPYANRDPRLKMTIVHNGMPWPATKAVETWEGGANASPLANATTTGYYLKKYVNKDISFVAGAVKIEKEHNWIIFRYAEILLNYAEAMINAYDDPQYKNVDLPLTALEAVNQVRARATVGMPSYPASISAQDFMIRLKNERRVEFAFEGQRFWDLRRWKDLGETADIYKVKVEKVNEVVEYTKTLLSTREISDKLYFYPIANTELFKNLNLKQNAGWE